MKFELLDVNINILTAMRRAGYTFQKQEGKKTAFVRPFSSSGFPRFHVFVETKERGLEISIHYDAKRETYGDSTAHHGEYENEGFLKEEADRLKMILS